MRKNYRNTSAATVEVFAHQKGAWHITALTRAAMEGAFPVAVLDTASAAAALSDEFDESTIRHISSHRELLERPLLTLEIDGGMLLLDGHHRLRVMALLGIPEFRSWIVPEGADREFRINLTKPSPSG